MLGSKPFAPFLLALLIGGCPKRQTTPRIVYVQAPAVTPSAVNSSAHAPPETLTIQEPVTESAEETPAPPPPAIPAPQAPPDKKKAPRTPTHDAGDKPPVEAIQPAPTTESPLQLEPAGGDVQEAPIGKQLEALTAELTDLERRTDLSADQQRAINDASTFRTQSLDALRQHDLLRAKQLADKAGLLINAVQGRH